MRILDEFVGSIPMRFESVAQLNCCRRKRRNLGRLHMRLPYLMMSRDSLGKVPTGRSCKRLFYCPNATVLRTLASTSIVVARKKSVHGMQLCD